MTALDLTSLQTLLSQTALGRREAFAQLYDLSAPKLFSVVLRILRNREWAEEVLQDAFINIWTRAGQYDPLRGAAPMTWMTQVARNVAFDYLRKPQLQTRDEEEAGEWLADSMDLLKNLEDKQTAGLLKQCLAHIEVKQRQTVMLSFWHGLTHVELAEQLSLPLGTVKTWLRRSLSVLKTCLESAEK